MTPMGTPSTMLASTRAWLQDITSDNAGVYDDGMPAGFAAGCSRRRWRVGDGTAFAVEEEFINRFNLAFCQEVHSQVWGRGCRILFIHGHNTSVQTLRSICRCGQQAKLSDSAPGPTR